jgi:hypothetical protein
MLGLLGALSLALLLLVALMMAWPLRLDVSAQARGEQDGGWAVAGGATLGALGAAFVWARGISPQVSLLLFGRKLSWKPTWPKWSGEASPRASWRLQRAMAKWWSRVDPLGLALQLLEERRHVRLRYVVVDLAYGFRDPLLTGRLVGALSALAAVLPAPIEIRQNPRWDFEDGWELALDSRAVLRPWLMALDVLLYVVRQAKS